MRKSSKVTQLYQQGPGCFASRHTIASQEPSAYHIIHHAAKAALPKLWASEPHRRGYSCFRVHADIRKVTQLHRQGLEALPVTPLLQEPLYMNHLACKQHHHQGFGRLSPKRGCSCFRVHAHILKVTQLHRQPLEALPVTPLLQEPLYMNHLACKQHCHQSGGHLSPIEGGAAVLSAECEYPQK